LTEPEYPVGVKIGVDVGMARVGVASCDPHGVLATPVRTLRRDAKKNSDIQLLVREVLERGAVQVFVGLPRTLKGGETASARMARDYAALLAAGLAARSAGVPVHMIDERLTTVSAHRSLRQAGLSTREHRKVVDQVAAVEILQQAIDMQRSLGRDVGVPVSVPSGRNEPGSDEELRSL
jgi:putative holliday junction resolvase